MTQSTESKSRRIFSWFVMAALPFIAVPAAVQSAPAAPASPVPQITFDQTSFDFGKIQFGQTVVHRFKVSNTGHANLHIKKVQAACGCTSTLIGKMDLAPGEHTEIEAAFTPESGWGPVRK